MKNQSSMPVLALDEFANSLIRRFSSAFNSSSNCIVTSLHYPGSIDDDEIKVMEYVFRELVCNQNHLSIMYVCTPQGNIRSVNVPLLHSFFDHNAMRKEDFDTNTFIDEYQLMDKLPVYHKDITHMVNFMGVKSYSLDMKGVLK